MILVMEMENDKSMDFFAGKKLPPGVFRIQSIDATLVGMKLQSSIAKRPPPRNALAHSGKKSTILRIVVSVTVIYY